MPRKKKETTKKVAAKVQVPGWTLPIDFGPDTMAGFINEVYEPEHMAALLFDHVIPASDKKYEIVLALYERLDEFMTKMNETEAALNNIYEVKAGL